MLHVNLAAKFVAIHRYKWQLLVLVFLCEKAKFILETEAVCVYKKKWEALSLLLRVSWDVEDDEKKSMFFGYTTVLCW